MSGSGYGYFRNKALNAQEFLSKQQGLEKTDFDRAQWGGSLGGPIVRDRTFFFGAADRATENTPFNNGILPENGRILGLPPEDVGDVNRFLNDTFAMGKITHKVNENNTLTGSYAMTFDVISNFQSAPSRGGCRFAVLGRSSRRRDLISTIAQMSASSRLSTARTGRHRIRRSDPRAATTHRARCSSECDSRFEARQHPPAFATRPKSRVRSRP